MGTADAGVFYENNVYPYVKEQQQQKKQSYVTNRVAGAPPSDVSLPRIAAGGIAPQIIGREIVRNPDMIWYGNIKPITQSTSKQDTVTDPNTGDETITTTITTTIIGYKIDVQFMVGLGPGCRLRTIYLDNAPIWTGTKGPNRDTFTVPNNALITDVIFSGGGFDQIIDPYLDSVITEDLSAYRGMAYVVLKGLETSKMSNMAFEIDRYPDPLGLGAHNKIGDDINPASAMVEIITSTWGGAGKDISLIGTSFAAAAEVLFTEGNGCSIINRQTVTANALNSILSDQIDGVIYEDHGSGKIELKLNRKTFDPELVVRLFDKDITDISGEKNSWQSIPTSIKVSYIDRSYDYRNIPIVARNLAANEKLSKSMATLDFPSVRNGTLATKLLGRDGARTGSPVQQISVTANRKAARLNPGDIVIITCEKYKYYSVPAIVVKRRTQPLKNNTVTLVCNVILYPNNTIIFAPPESSFFVPVDPSPHAPVLVRALSAPWSFRSDNPPTQPFGTTSIDLFYVGEVQNDQLLVFGNAYNQSQQYIRGHYRYGVADFLPFYSNSGISIQNGQFVSTDTDFQYPLYAKLTTAISKYDNWDGSSVSQQIVIKEIGPQTLVMDSIIASIAKGIAFNAYIFIDDEIFKISTERDPGNATVVYNASLRTATFTCVRRSIVDTVAQDHAINADVFIMMGSGYASKLGIYYTQTADLVFTGTASPKNTYTESNIAIGYAATHLGVDRANRPFRPHNTKIDAARDATPHALVRAASSTITWFTRGRNRKNTDSRPYQLDASQPAEINGSNKHVVYRVWIADSAAVEWDCGATADTADHSSLIITVPAGAAVGVGSLWVNAEYDPGSGVKVSLYKDKLPITLS